MHYWPLDESTSVISDVVNNKLGVVVGDISGDTFMPIGKFGRARRLNPNNLLRRIHLYIEEERFDYTLNEWSLSLWFRLDAPGLIGSKYLLSFGGYTENANTAEVAITSYDPVHHQNWAGANNLVELWVSGPAPGYENILTGSWSLPGGGNVDGEPTAETLLDKDHLLVVTCDGQNIALYLDGDQVISGAGSAALSPWTAANYVGGDSSSSDHFGWVDDIAIWGEGLTSNDVGLLWSGGIGLSAGSFSAGPVETFTYDPMAHYFSYLDIKNESLPTIRVPISSWQATLRNHQSTFLQAVIPAAAPWSEAITSRVGTGEIVISYAMSAPSGAVTEWEVARVPLQQFTLDRGPTNTTGRVVGYAPGAGGNPQIVSQLRDVRSVSISTGGVRIRCALDPNVRPGQTAEGAGQSFIVGWVNYYANDSDRYMDVGESTG